MSVVQRAAGLALCFAFAAPAQDAPPDPEKALSGVVKTQRVRVRFRPDSRAEASVDRVAALVEDDLNRILKELDFQQFRHVVQLFLYDDLDDLARTTGVPGTGGFSVPLTSHVPHDNDQTRVHELVHVVAEKFGDRGPETRNLFSAEGLANAVLRYVHGVHVDCVAAFYRKRGELPPLAEMLGAKDFYAWMGSRPGFNAYDVAGSFFRFLLDVHGPQKTRRFYVGHSAKDAFGVDLPALEAKWHARLDAVTLRPGTLKLLTERAGGVPGGKREADRLALTLLEIQPDYRPKNAGSDPQRVLSSDEEQRVRWMAEALARDVRRRLDPTYRSSWPPYLPPVASPPPGYEAVRWETLVGFEYREGMVLPEEVRRLHGRPVALSGYVTPLDEIDEANECLLVPRLWRLNEIGPWPMTHYVLVRSGKRDIKVGAFGEGPVAAVGVLDVGEVFADDGLLMSVYRLNVDGPDSVFKSRDP